MASAATQPAQPAHPSDGVDKSGPKVQQMFGQIAGRYDLLNHVLSLNIDRYWRWRTARLVPPVPGGRVLDACTGTGDLAIAYHNKADGKAEVIATDFCPEMLDIGREKGVKTAEGGPEFIEADTQHLPMPDDHFDVVSVAFGLRNVADTDAGIREMTRVCKPGGRLAVLEFSTPQWQPFKAVYGWYFRNVLPRIGQLVARNSWDAYHYLPESVGEFPQGEALLDRMRVAGLTDCWRRVFTLGVATLYVGTKPATEG
ncbi:MAG: bifunctional demethylmenaquinone methyltransferase/2-methoxy-6-polyprenyl-1,4-benzoquinol methylase UbiE [Planctomycetota bacterium]